MCNCALRIFSANSLSLLLHFHDISNMALNAYRNYIFDGNKSIHNVIIYTCGVCTLWHICLSQHHLQLQFILFLISLLGKYIHIRCLHLCLVFTLSIWIIFQYWTTEHAIIHQLCDVTILNPNALLLTRMKMIYLKWQASRIWNQRSLYATPTKSWSTLCSVHWCSAFQFFLVL